MNAVKIRTSGVINAPIEFVWELVRNFSALDQWHPHVESCKQVSGTAMTEVGSEREFVQNGGAVIREKLLALDDYKYRTAYSVLEAPAPFDNYIASIVLLPIYADNKTLMQWNADFNWAEDPTEIKADLENLFSMAFESLGELYKHTKET